MMKETYKSLNKSIYPNEELIQKTQKQMRDEMNGSMSHGKKVKRLRLVLAVIVLCILLIMPVIALNLSSFDNLLYFIAPDVAQQLQPLELYSENDGLKLEVVAAMNDNDTIVAYLTLQDIEGKGRVDDTIDLYNYGIRGYRSFTHEVTNYDLDTQTATIRLVGNGGKDMDNKKITFQLDSFLSNKVNYDDVLLDIDLTNNDVDTIELSNDSSSGGSGEEINRLEEMGTMQIIKPMQNEVIMSEEIDFVKVSGTGFINGKFHIQTKWDESVDNHGFIVLKRDDCKDIYSSNIYFDIDEEKTIYGRQYIEYIYDVSKEDIHNYNVYGTFIQDGLYTEGEWKVTFDLKAVDDRSVVLQDVKVNDTTIDSITITPLGITIEGEEKEIKDMEVMANTGDQIVRYESRVINSEKGKSYMKLIPTLPINIDDIEELKINEKLITIY